MYMLMGHGAMHLVHMPNYKDWKYALKGKVLRNNT